MCVCLSVPIETYILALSPTQVLVQTFNTRQVNINGTTLPVFQLEQDGALSH